MLEQQVAERAGDGDLAAPVLGLGLDLLAVSAVPARLDVDHARRKVGVFPAERLELAESQPRVQRGPVERAVAQLERVEQLPGVLEARDADAVAGSPDLRDGDAAGRVHGEVAAVDGAAVDRPERQDRALHGRRLEPLRDELVDEVLDVDLPHVRQLARAEHRQNVQP